MSDASPVVLVVHPGAELFGSDRMLLESVIGLREAGCRVVVALPMSGPLVAELEATGAEVETVPMLVLRKALLKPRGWFTLLRSAVQGLIAGRRLLGEIRPDAIYVSTVIIPQWPLLGRARRVRTVSHVHEAETTGSRVIWTALYLPHLASHRTLVNSAFSLRTLRRALPPLARRSTVLYNGVASPQDPPAPRRDLEGPLRILYVGRLSPRKGPDLVLEAAAQLARAGRPAQVTLLGAVFAGYEWFEQQLREQAGASGVDVEFAGFHPDIWPFLAAADVLVVPSRLDETFGNTAVEGVLALRPVVASDAGGLREAAGPFETARLVAADDAAAIAVALSGICAAWPDVVGTVAGSRDQALERHAPGVYQENIVRAVLGRTR